VKVRLLAAAVTLGLASVAWTTSAAADNPHGTPPGQQNASASATVNASTQTNASAHANGKAHAKAAVAVKAKGQAKAKASGHANGTVKTQAQPTVSAGVEPSSATSKNALEAATSNKTKLYGNGKTAGQIAVQAGFGASTLYGPGNSQPHKTSCGVHSVDVHALKAHSAASCGTTATTTSAATRVHGHARGHVGLGVLAHVSASLVTALGMKPASATAKNTLEAATSNKTKLYGNGTTAGQIAIQAGFGSAMLFGPGNSQPHKTTCGAHMIDVHALKAHGGAAACATPSVSTSETSSVSPAQANVAAEAAAQAQAAGNSGVLSAKASGAAKTKSAPAKTNKHAGGVLSAKAALAATAKKPLRLVATVRHGNLPFTGLALWLPMVLGLGMIATGLAMRRKSNSLA
jgi:hypothetical protein